MKTPTQLKDLISYQNAAVVSKELAKAAGGTVTLFAFDAGQGLSEHTAPFDALVYIVDGQAEVTIAGITHVLNTGDIIKMPANHSHALQAREKFVMLLIMLKS